MFRKAALPIYHSWHSPKNCYLTPTDRAHYGIEEGANNRPLIKPSISSSYCIQDLLDDPRCPLMIKVIPIPTGKAWMKSAQKCGGRGRNPFQRKIDIFRDKNWVGPLDIFAWLIEHPEGGYR